MKTPAASARVMVATDNVDDADQILRQLKQDFQQLRASTQAERMVEDFEDFRPDVLMLAFDSLDKAQRYYLGLYRLGQTIHHHRHRTVILCKKEEVRAVFELCKQEYFDDYVLYWPHSYDGPRLAMSVWSACREMMGLQRETGPSNAELMAHARHLRELEQALDTHLLDGERQVAGARQNSERAEREIAGAIDAFSSRLIQHSASGALQLREPGLLASELDQLKRQQLAQARALGRGVESLGEWTSRLREGLEPALSGARELGSAVDGIRPLVMLVDDDPLVHQQVQAALADGFDVLAVDDGGRALSQLRRVRPDLMLVDLRMPGIDGVALTQRVKAAPPTSTIPVIMMTGDARRETLVSSIDAGAIDFIVKPIARDALVAKLKKVLSGG